MSNSNADLAPHPTPPTPPSFQTRTFFQEVLNDALATRAERAAEANDDDDAQAEPHFQHKRDRQRSRDDAKAYDAAASGGVGMGRDETLYLSHAERLFITSSPSSDGRRASEGVRVNRRRQRPESFDATASSSTSSSTTTSSSSSAAAAASSASSTAANAAVAAATASVEAATAITRRIFSGKMTIYESDGLRPWTDYFTQVGG